VVESLGFSKNKGGVTAVKKPSFRLTLSKKRALLGYAFTLPFAVGFAVFFLIPFSSIHHLQLQ